MKFEIYRSKQNASHYVAIIEGDSSENAKGVRASDNLDFLTVIADEGEGRIAFDAKEAVSRIERDGFYAFAVTITPRERMV